MTFPNPPHRTIGSPSGLVNPVYAWYDGQSNAAGQGIEAVPSTVGGSWHYCRRYEEIYRVPGQWERVGRYTVDQAFLAGTIHPSKHGSQVAFAQAALAAGRTPVIITTGRNGVSLTEWSPGNSCYALFDSVWAELEASIGISSKNIFYLWSQGESGPSAGSYEPLFSAWIDHMRAKLPNSYIVARAMPTAVDSGGALAAVFASVIASKGNGEVLDASNTTTYPWVNPHWTSAGLNALGAAEYAIASAHV